MADGMQVPPGMPPKPAGAPPVTPGAAPSVGGAGASGPLSSPMATPQPMAGVEKGARIQIQVASQMLQRELPHFPLDSEQFKAVSDALRTLQKAFGKSQDEDQKLFPAEIMNMLSAVGPGSKTPGQQAVSGAPPMGGGAPGAGAQPG